MANKNKKTAFTLAEVLIALAIIGIIATLTIPAVIKNYQERKTITHLKKVISQLNSATQRAVIENGATNGWGWGDTDWSPKSAHDIFAKLLPYLGVLKKCDIGRGCWYNGNTKSLDGSNYTFAPNIDTRSDGVRCILQDGTSVFFLVNNAARKQGMFIVDLNGIKQPNQVGRDVFALYLQNNAVKPPKIVNNNYARCDIAKPHRDNGVTCSAWIVKNENMNYLKK